MQPMNFFRNLLTNKFAKKIGKKNRPQNKRVFVGISGGVDSAVSALLLKNAGYDVTGVFIRTWQPDFIECTWRNERRDAIRICAHLSIPFLELDAEQQYKDMVGMQMVNDYKNGLTPNPDILCNREVKFGVFWNFAKSLGADYIATGHYAKIEKINNEFYMQKPKDSNKDQTYFLWTLQNSDLEHVLFPLADLTKSQVREIANKNNLPNANKKDSQGVCFLGHIDIKDFISHYTKLIPGDVLDTEGNIIGKHDGAIVYTLGQRHGFHIEKQSDNEKPYYIVERDTNKNTITVSHTPTEQKFLKDSYTIKSGYIRQIADTNIEALYRYNGELVKVKSISKSQDKDGVIIMLEKPVLISSGQSIVFYKGDILVGGGICSN